MNTYRTLLITDLWLESLFRQSNAARTMLSIIAESFELANRGSITWSSEPFSRSGNACDQYGLCRLDQQSLQIENIYFLL